MAAGLEAHQHFAMEHQSKALGRSVSVEDVDEIDPDDIRDLASEVGWALTAINGRIKSANIALHSEESALTAAEVDQLYQRRSFLAGLHQRLLQRRSQNKRQEEERRRASESEQASDVPDLPHYFQQVVRNECRAVDYQRWILQAEIRRSADMRRNRQDRRSGASGRH